MRICCITRSLREFTFGWMWSNLNSIQHYQDWVLPLCDLTETLKLITFLGSFQKPFFLRFRWKTCCSKSSQMDVAPWCSKWDGWDGMGLHHWLVRFPNHYFWHLWQLGNLTDPWPVLKINLKIRSVLTLFKPGFFGSLVTRGGGRFAPTL